MLQVRRAEETIDILDSILWSLETSWLAIGLEHVNIIRFRLNKKARTLVRATSLVASITSITGNIFHSIFPSDKIISEAPVASSNTKHSSKDPRSLL